MLAVAKFYGWTLAQIRDMSLFEFRHAQQFMTEGGAGNGSR